VETGRFAPYVLTGLGVEENLFWTGTELDVTYVPLNVRRQPFFIGNDENASGDGAANVLCVDIDSPCIDASGNKSIVDADGKDSAYLREMLAVLGELVAGRAITGQFIESVLSLDLIAPIVLDIVLDDGTPLQLQGLYGLDEDRFRQLTASDLAELWRKGHLDLLYAVLMSGGQIFKLVQLKNQRNALSRAWQSANDPRGTGG
jgi:hypothetical protein